MRLLGIKSGMTVADIGAGSGYYVVRLSPIVGSSGRIIAEDIVPEYLRSLRQHIRDLALQNVIISLGEPWAILEPGYQRVIAKLNSRASIPAKNARRSFGS